MLWRRKKLSPYWAAKREVQKWHRRTARLKAVARGSILLILGVSIGLAIFPFAHGGHWLGQNSTHSDSREEAPVTQRPSFRNAIY